MKLEKDELATVLAALRYYQEKGMGEPCNRSDAIDDIATSCGEVISLDASAIDRLCEKLNVVEETAMLAVVIEGGMVQSIVSNNPSALNNIEAIMVIDYDDENAEDGDLIDVPQANGTIADALCHSEGIELATIDLNAVLKQLEARP